MMYVDVNIYNGSNPLKQLHIFNVIQKLC